MSVIASGKTYPSFVEAVWPRLDLKREILLVLAGSWLMALLAQVAVPLWPVPITGQTFGVLLIGALLGSRRGALTVLAYLAQGALGLPVFSGGMGGLARFAGPTGGYLLGFVAAAFVVGWLTEQGMNRTFATTAFSMLVGNAVIYAVGLPFLAAFVGWDVAFKLGILPFLLGDVLKVILAAVVLPQAWARVMAGNAQ